MQTDVEEEGPLQSNQAAMHLLSVGLWLAVVAIASAMVGETRRGCHWMTRRPALALLSLAAVATLAVTASAWFLLPVQAGFDRPFAYTVGDDGYTRAYLAVGWMLCLGASAAILGALLAKFSAGSLQSPAEARNV